MKSNKFFNVLFDELLIEFESLHALLRCPVDGAVVPNSETQFTIDEFIVLLKYSMMVLKSLEFDSSLMWDKCGVLCKILGKVSLPCLVLDSHELGSVTTRNSHSQCCSYSFGGINKEPDQLLIFFALILEVFIDEISENVALRKHLIFVKFLTSKSEKPYSRQSSHTDSCTILELISSHFLVSVKNGLAFSRFLHLFSGSSEFNKMTPMISMDTSLKLISTPFILSAPYIIQAHLILLASRCISTHLAIDSRKSDTPSMSCHIDPFELSVKLYLSYLSTLQLDDAILGANFGPNFRIIAPLSDSTMHRIIWGKFTYQANDLGDFSYLPSECILSGTKSEVLAYSTAYIHGNHPIINQLCKEATCLVVNYMMENILPRKLWEQGHNEDKGKFSNEVYCLAAAMNLMNSSLLHIICPSKQTGFQVETKIVRDCPSCITYECLSQSASIVHISQCGAEQHVKKYLFDIFGAYGGMHMKIKFMLAHISTLLIFSFKRKLNFLWKGCISMMLTLMNLLLFEERKLGLSKIFNFLESHPKMDVEDLTFRSTSVKIAANLEKSRMLYLKNKTQYGQADQNWEVEQQSGFYREAQTNTCNGQRLIECIPNLHTTECEDLVDFIECSPQKDYSSWLSNRSKFVKWNLKRNKLFKCQKRRKRAFDMMKGHILKAKIRAGKGIKVKSPERQSEYIEDRRHQREGKEPSADHADSSKRHDFGIPIEGTPEKAEEQADLLKSKSKRKRIFAVVREYDLRERVAPKKYKVK